MVVQLVQDQVVRVQLCKILIMNKTILIMFSILILTLTNCIRNVNSNKVEPESTKDKKRKFYKIEDLSYTTDSSFKDSIDLNALIKEYE